MYVFSLSSIVSVGISIMLDGTSTTSATSIRVDRCIFFLEIFIIMMKNSLLGINYMIPGATMASLILISRGCEIILINPASLVCT